MDIQHGGILMNNNFKAGSNTKEGFIYHELPDSGLPSQRTGTQKRADFIADKVKLKNKKVLDLGCNVGGISYCLSKKGAHVIGVDYDGNAISIGTNFLKDKDVNCHLFEKEISPEYIKSLDKMDVVVWLSQWQWYVKQYGIEAGLDALFEISKICKTFVFETAADDGRANIEGATQDTIYSWLIRSTAFSKIDRYKVGDKDWHSRDLFICSNPVFEWRRHRHTLIKRIDRHSVEKISEDGKMPEDMVRDINFLKELDEYQFFPKLIDVKQNSFVMTYEGITASDISDKDIQEIVKILKEKNITHRDIIPSNLLWNGRNTVLIDFGWAIHEGEDYDTPENLGEKYKSPDGFDDEYSLKFVQKELRK